METLTAQSYFSRLMMDGIDYGRLKKEPVGGLSFFGASMGNGGGTKYVPDSEVIEFDVRDRNRGSSTYIHRGQLGQPMNKPKHVSGRFTSIARTFPLLSDTGVITKGQLLKRVYDEDPAKPITQFERARRNANLILEDIVLDHVSAMERSAWEMLKTGKQSLIFGTSSEDEQIDTKRNSTHTFTVTASWATDSTSILDSCDSVCTLGVLNGSGAFDGLVVGTSIPGYLANNTEIQTYANISAAGTSGYSLVYFGDNVKPDSKFAHLIANGFNPICKVRTKMGREITVFTYEGTYGSSNTYHVTAKEAVFFRSDATCDRQFGPPETLDPTEQMQRDWDSIFGYAPDNIQLPSNIDGTPRVIEPACFYCDIQRFGKNSAYEISCQAAPILTTRDTNSFAYIADVTST